MFFRNPAIVRHDRSAVTQASEIFCREETERTRIRPRTRGPCPCASAVGLRCVFHHIQTVPLRNSTNTYYVDELPIKVNCENRFRPWGYRLRNPSSIYIVSVLIRLDGNRQRSGT